MKHTKRLLSVLLALVLTLQCSAFAADDASAEESGQWTRAWSTSMVEATISELVSTAKADTTAKKILAMLAINVGFAGQKLSCRMNVQPTVAGEKIRLVLSNENGLADVTISAMTAAKSNEKNLDRIKTSTLQTVTVNGAAEFTIPAGERVTTDPIDLEVEALEHISVTMYLDGLSSVNTVGLIGGDSYLYTGDRTTTDAAALGLYMNYTENSGEYSILPLLCGVDVYREESASACVIIGDSTVANDVPILLEEKLQNNGITNVAVLQAAIKGNELLHDGQGTLGGMMGQACKDRFMADAVNLPGVDTIIVKIGINDLIHPACTSLKANYTNLDTSNEAMINGYQKLIDMAHNAGKKIYFYSLGAWEGYTRNLFDNGDDVACTASLEERRDALNEWLSQCGADGYFDTSPMNDPTDRHKQLAAYTTDGCHLTASGQQALVDLIPLGVFGNSCEHEWVTEPAVAATCEAAGHTEKIYCSKCGLVKKAAATIDATGHKYGAATVTKAATCTETGASTRTCSVCGKSVQTTISPLGHNYQTTATVAATCTSQGSTTAICSRCGGSKTTVLPVTEHSWNDGMVTKAATESENGVKTYTCAVCGATKTEVLPALGHTHSYTVSSVTAPTCTEGGYTTYICSGCGDSYTGDYTSATGHSYTTGTVAATCTAQGYTLHTCTVCGESYKDGYTALAEHSWDAGVVTKAATESESGVKTYTCTVCGTTKTEPLSPAAHTHSYTAAVTPPTCTEAGYTTYICSGCGDSYKSNYTSATGHTAVADAAVAATCTTAGKTAGSHCSICGAVLTAQETVPALGHSYVSGVCTRCGDVNWTNPFVDVASGRFYYKAVLWAVNQTPQITRGTDSTHFSPLESCTRAQVVTFLWRAMGSPEPQSATCPFTDVNPKGYYYDAVLWAAENGITAGTDSTHFSPEETVTRAQFVTFLWRCAGKPASSGDNPFTDLRDGAYYTRAVLWAAENAITTGVTASSFAPDEDCTRGQVVTFLYRYFSRL